ncbi:MAG: ABC transporter ATP-binding protein/permease [Tannerella sp.]|jgi:ABC-type multidrug transport system fused ATPase/permease subunit|nr:ABC transporter ATP-binding protein/permease [Tannerella sp.]
MKRREDIKREINTLKFVWKMAGGQHGKIILASVLSIAAGLLPAIVAWFFKNYMDNHQLDFNNLLNVTDLTVFFGLITGGMLIKTASGFIMGYTMPNVKRNIEISCVKKISGLPYPYISDCIDNRIIMTMSLESNMITSLIPMVYNSFIKAPVTVLGFVAVLFFASAKLTVIGMVLILTVVAGVVLFRRKIKELNKKSYNRIGDLHNYFSEWLSGYRVFLASNATRFVEKNLIGVSKELCGLSKKMAKISAAQSLIIEILTISVTVLFIVIATHGKITGTGFNIGTLILFPAAILFVRGEILKIIYGYMQLAGTESAAKRMIDILEYPVGQSANTNHFDEDIQTLSLQNIGFSYANTKQPIFENANITFRQGELNVVKGRSGTGKTTLITLCMGLRLPDTGAILLNGKNINSFNEENLLSKTGLVEQEPFIFEGTLAENLFFDRTPDAQYVLNLMNDFDLSHLAKTEKELFSVKIGKKERQLSTGEKQRIALIRALVKQAKLIFFDEVTSNLDRENAEKIIECIKKIAKDKLVICVSHDRLLLQEAENLYEIENGKIECTGTNPMKWNL